MVAVVGTWAIRGGPNQENWVAFRGLGGEGSSQPAEKKVLARPLIQRMGWDGWRPQQLVVRGVGVTTAGPGWCHNLSKPNQIQLRVPVFPAPAVEILRKITSNFQIFIVFHRPIVGSVMVHRPSKLDLQKQCVFFFNWFKCRVCAPDADHKMSLVFSCADRSQQLFRMPCDQNLVAHFITFIKNVCQQKHPPGV